MIRKTDYTRGMITRIKVITISLERLFVVLTPFIGNHSRDYLKAWNTYSYYFTERLNNNGKYETVRVYKELFQIAVSISLGISFTPISFMKTGKDGVPKPLKPLVNLLRGSKWDKRIGLTIARIYTLIRVKPSLDVDSITRPSKYEYDTNYVTAFETFVKKNLKPVGNLESKLDFGFGARSGPNGPAVLTAHYDAHALKEYGLSDVWKQMSELVGSPLRGSFASCLGSKIPDGLKLHVGKIAFLSEKGGKTRPIAMVDFWSQQLLKTFHQSIMMVMVRLMGETDSTYDQNTAFKRAMLRSQGKRVYSFDLKSATDRFPFILQKIVFSTLFGEKIANLWERLMLRPFYVHELKTDVMWRVGQPLGAYSSWPIFSLTHHLFVRFSANDYSFKDYQLLGDDIIIWDEKVALSYKDILDRFDVEISPAKSLVSLDTSKVFGEFAKRIFYGTDEISPLSPTVIEQSGSLYAFPTLINHVCDRWALPLDLSELLSLESFPAKGRRLLAILFGARHLAEGEIRWPWCSVGFSTIDSLLREIINTLQANQIKSLFSKSPSKIKFVRAKGENTYDPKDLCKEFAKLGIVVSDSLLSPAFGEDGDDPHPIILALSHINKVELEGQGLKDFINPLVALSEDYVPEVHEQIALYKTSKIPSVPPLDIFFYTPTDRVTPRTILEIYFTLAGKMSK
jgi:hypothetical protein